MPDTSVPVGGHSCPIQGVIETLRWSREILITKVTLVLSAACLIPLQQAVAESSQLPTLTPNIKVLKISHRGVKKFAPENTIPAIEKAIELGFDFVELDIHYTADGYPVVIHDSFVDRTTPAHGPVAKYTLKEITMLDAGLYFDEKFKGTKVPSLEDALKVMQGKIKLYLDQKELPKKMLLELLKKYNFYPDNIVVVGNNLFQKMFRLLAPDAPVMPKLSSVENINTTLKAFPHPEAFNVNYRDCSPELVRSAHKHGVKVFVNTLQGGEKAEIMHYLIDCGVDAIQTDHPDMLIKVIESYKK